MIKRQPLIRDADQDPMVTILRRAGREKERERNERGSERADSKRENKDDWMPMGINKWGATVRANPVYKKVSRASKCLSTRDWNVCSLSYHI